MTTIAYRSGIVAFDSRVTAGNVVQPEILKKARYGTNHPVIFACCGALTDAVTYVARLERLKQLPWDDVDAWSEANFPTLDGATIMVVTRDARVWFIEGNGFYEAEGKFTAMGTGATPALAALHMGASAAKAVEIACMLDTHSSPPVETLSIRGIPEPPKRRRGSRK